MLILSLRFSSLLLLVVLMLMLVLVVVVVVVVVMLLLLLLLVVVVTMVLMDHQVLGMLLLQDGRVVVKVVPMMMQGVPLSLDSLPIPPRLTALLLHPCSLGHTLLLLLLFSPFLHTHPKPPCREPRMMRVVVLVVKVMMGGLQEALLLTLHVLLQPCCGTARVAAMLLRQMLL